MRNKTFDFDARHKGYFLVSSSTEEVSEMHSEQTPNVFLPLRHP